MSGAGRSKYFQGQAKSSAERGSGLDLRQIRPQIEKDRPVVLETTQGPSSKAISIDLRLRNSTRIKMNRMTWGFRIGFANPSTFRKHLNWNFCPWARGE